MHMVFVRDVMSGQQAQDHRIEEAGEEVFVRGLVANHGSDRSRQVTCDQLGAAVKLDADDPRPVGTVRQRNIEEDRALEPVDALVFTGTPEAMDLETPGAEQVALSRRLVPAGQAGEVPPPLGVAEQADGHQPAPRPRLDVQSRRAARSRPTTLPEYRGPARRKRPREADVVSPSRPVTNGSSSRAASSSSSSSRSRSISRAQPWSGHLRNASKSRNEIASRRRRPVWLRARRSDKGPANRRTGSSRLMQRFGRQSGRSLAVIAQRLAKLARLRLLPGGR